MKSDTFTSILLAAILHANQSSALPGGFMGGDICERLLLIQRFEEIHAERGKVELINGTPRNSGRLRKIFNTLSGFDNREFEVLYHGQIIKGVKASWGNVLPTLRAYSAKGRVPAGSEVILQLWHGIGAARSSHIGSLMDPLRTFSNDGGKIRTAVDKRLRSQGHSWVSVAAEAIDLPDSGHGPATIFTPSRDGSLQIPFLTAYSTLASTMRKLRSYTVELQHKGKGLPVVNLARSAAVGLSGEMDYRYPGLLAGLIFIGPLHPGVGFKHSVDRHHQMVSEGIIKPNYESFNWVNKMYESMHWHERLYLSKTPLLIMVGEYDREVSQEARAWFRKLSNDRDNVRYVEISGAGHDVLLPTRARVEDGTQVPSYRPDQAYYEIHRFLTDSVLTEN